MSTASSALVRGIMVTALTVTSITAISATSARAQPGGCTTRAVTSIIGNRGAESWCTHGSGKHRIGINCTGPNGRSYDRLGPWVNTGGTSWSDASSEGRVSTRYCDSDFNVHILNYRWVETKS